MALSARIPSGADTAGFVPDIWSAKVCDAMQNNLVAWSAFETGEFRSDLKKGHTVNIPISNHVTATEIAIGTKASSLDPATGSAKTLTVSYYYEAPIDVDYMTTRQSQVDWATMVQKEAAYAIAKKMDSSLLDIVYNLGGYTTSAYGSDGQTLTDDLLLYLFQTLNEADVPIEDRVLILDPSGVVDLLKVDKFIAAQYANNTGAVNQGVIGKSPIYACTVKMTNNLKAATTGSYAVMAHKEALIGVAQMEPSWAKEFKELHVTRYQSEALWGVAEYRDDFGIPFYTRHA
jgi:hypothetical protein